MELPLLSSLAGIYYYEGNLAFLKPSLFHFDCGFQLLYVPVVKVFFLPVPNSSIFMKCRNLFSGRGVLCNL